MDDLLNETLNFDNNDYEIENLLNKSISKTNLGAVTDVTDQFVLINIKGDKIYDLFETGSPLILIILETKRFSYSNDSR